MKAHELLPIILANPEADVFVNVPLDNKYATNASVPAKHVEFQNIVMSDKGALVFFTKAPTTGSSGSSGSKHPVAPRDYFSRPAEPVVTQIQAGRQPRHAPLLVAAVLKEAHDLLVYPFNVTRTELPNGLIVEDLAKELHIETSVEGPTVFMTTLTDQNGTSVDVTRYGPGDTPTKPFSDQQEQAAVNNELRSAQRIELNSVLQGGLTSGVLDLALVETVHDFVKKYPEEVEGCLKRAKKHIQFLKAAQCTGQAAGGVASQLLKRAGGGWGGSARGVFPTRQPGGAR